MRYVKLDVIVNFTKVYPSNSLVYYFYSMNLGLFLIVLFFFFCYFFFQAEDGIRDRDVTGVQTCALPILATRLLISRITSPSTSPARAASLPALTSITTGCEPNVLVAEKPRSATVSGWRDRKSVV